jgi:hypothetical protein
LRKLFFLQNIYFAAPWILPPGAIASFARPPPPLRYAPEKWGKSPSITTYFILNLNNFVIKVDPNDGYFSCCFIKYKGLILLKVVYQTRQLKTAFSTM